MAWSTIRRATDEDIDRINAAEGRFVNRYGVHPDDVDRERADGFGLINGYTVSYLNCQWRKRVRRALREPAATGVAYGYVGYHVD